jgi:hypothetical protein
VATRQHTVAEGFKGVELPLSLICDVAEVTTRSGLLGPGKPVYLKGRLIPERRLPRLKVPTSSSLEIGDDTRQHRAAEGSKGR